MRPLVFLDFDDVLAVHHFQNIYEVMDSFSHGETRSTSELWRDVFDTVAKRNLGALHMEFLPNYVITSTWASYLNREQIGQVLSRTGLQFVQENLCEAWRTPRNANSSRRSEIESWLDKNATARHPAYVIIDDKVSGGALVDSWLEQKTVFCDAWVGFTSAKLCDARRVLQRQTFSQTNEVHVTDEHAGSERFSLKVQNG